MGAAQQGSGLCVMFLGEGDAGELDGETRIRGGEAKAGFECSLCFGQTSEMREGNAVVVLLLGGACGLRAKEADDLAPMMGGDERIDLPGRR